MFPFEVAASVHGAEIPTNHIQALLVTISSIKNY